MADEPNGLRARVDYLDRNQQEVFRRLRVVDRLDERMRSVERGVDGCAKNCEAIRAYVDSELDKQQLVSGERRKLRSTEKVAIIGAIAVVLASLIAAVASLIAAGAF